MTDTASEAPAHLTSIGTDRGPMLVAGGGLAAGFLGIAALVDLRQATLFVIGGLLGLALYHGSFGFTGGWRRMAVERRGHGMRAQMLMIAVAAICMIPLVAAGNLGGQALVGAIAPVGVSVLLGAALFGLGMQLGGGCGSGTLFTVGGGSSRMLVTLAFFIVGALIGTAHLPWWLERPSLPPISLGQHFGIVAAILGTLAFLAVVALLTALVEWRRHGNLEREPAPSGPGWSWVLRGPWPLVGAGVCLAVLNVATLLLAGHPWSVTAGFGLWGPRSRRPQGSRWTAGSSGTGPGSGRRWSPASLPTASR